MELYNPCWMPWNMKNLPRKCSLKNSGTLKRYVTLRWKKPVIFSVSDSFCPSGERLAALPFSHNSFVAKSFKTWVTANKYSKPIAVGDGEHLNGLGDSSYSQPYLYCRSSSSPWPGA